MASVPCIIKSGNVGPRELKKAEKELKKEFPNGIPTCGTDALRFTLASYLQQGEAIMLLGCTSTRLKVS